VRQAAAARKIAVNRPVESPVTPGTERPPRPEFEFTYSERYNLKRLPKDVAAAIRKKLEAEGH
jgi:hypothetical protein